MDWATGRALCGISTSNQWSLLTSLVPKLNRKLPASAARLAVEEAADFLGAFSAAELQHYGIWMEGWGTTAIVCINPAYRRARMTALGVAGRDECACVGAGDDAGAAGQKYFGSHAYNAGRHCSTQSHHKANCIEWSPASTGHLHSWRRGHTDKTKRT
jgi:hypothetical protein